MLRRKRARQESTRPGGAGDEFGFEERMDAILGDVRAEADRILEDARRRAATAGENTDQRLVDRRQRLLELADELTARAEHVLGGLQEAEQARRSLDGMVRALGQAADEITFEVSASPLGPRAGAPEQSPAPDDDADREAAIQMAAAGATRSQVDAHLREFSQADNPTAVLDEVFGFASGDDARVPWAMQREDR